MPQQRPEPSVGRIGDKGRVTLPQDVRRRYGLKEGDLVTIIETSEGILIAPQAVVAQKLLDQLNQALGDIPLDEWIETGRAQRPELTKELYGIDTTSDARDQGVH
jgi:AbrB family looped-hinge helix DNA binding protein